MQYILSQEEYNALQSKRKEDLRLSQKKLQTLCTKIADTMPVKWGWGQPDDPKPWGCYLSKDYEWYCDKCPVTDICPAPKAWSK
jgi:hypothetical protein